MHIKLSITPALELWYGEFEIEFEEDDQAKIRSSKNPVRKIRSMKIPVKNGRVAQGNVRAGRKR